MGRTQDKESHQEDLIVWWKGPGLCHWMGRIQILVRHLLLITIVDKLLHLEEFQSPRLKKVHKNIDHTRVVSGIRWFLYVIEVHEAIVSPIPSFIRPAKSNSESGLCGYLSTSISLRWSHFFPSKQVANDESLAQKSPSQRIKVEGLSRQKKIACVERNDGLWYMWEQQVVWGVLKSAEYSNPKIWGRKIDWNPILNGQALTVYLPNSYSSFKTYPKQGNIELAICRSEAFGMESSQELELKGCLRRASEWSGIHFIYLTPLSSIPNGKRSSPLWYLLQLSQVIYLVSFLCFHPSSNNVYIVLERFFVSGSSTRRR